MGRRKLGRPRLVNWEPRPRISMSVSKLVRDRIDRIKAETECESITEVVRLALSLLETVVNAQREGGRTVVCLPNSSYELRPYPLRQAFHSHGSSSDPPPKQT